MQINDDRWANITITIKQKVIYGLSSGILKVNLGPI